jgi:hypothetical protein
LSVTSSDDGIRHHPKSSRNGSLKAEGYLAAMKKTTSDTDIHTPRARGVRFRPLAAAGLRGHAVLLASLGLLVRAVEVTGAAFGAIADRFERRPRLPEVSGVIVEVPQENRTDTPPQSGPRRKAGRLAAALARVLPVVLFARTYGDLVIQIAPAAIELARRAWEVFMGP